MSLDPGPFILGEVVEHIVITRSSSTGMPDCRCARRRYSLQCGRDRAQAVVPGSAATGPSTPPFRRGGRSHRETPTQVDRRVCRSGGSSATHQSANPRSPKMRFPTNNLSIVLFRFTVSLTCCSRPPRGPSGGYALKRRLHGPCPRRLQMRRTAMNPMLCRCAGVARTGLPRPRGAAWSRVRAVMPRKRTIP